jgi:hypothetical protein
LKSLWECPRLAQVRARIVVIVARARETNTIGAAAAGALLGGVAGPAGVLVGAIIGALIGDSSVPT